MTVSLAAVAAAYALSVALLLIRRIPIYTLDRAAYDKAADRYLRADDIAQEETRRIWGTGNLSTDGAQRRMQREKDEITRAFVKARQQHQGSAKAVKRAFIWPVEILHFLRQVWKDAK